MRGDMIPLWDPRLTWETPLPHHSAHIAGRADQWHSATATTAPTEPEQSGPVTVLGSNVKSSPQGRETGQTGTRNRPHREKQEATT